MTTLPTTDFKAQLDALYKLCVQYQGGYKVTAMPDGPEKHALGVGIISSPVIDLIDSELAHVLKPQIHDINKTPDERVRIIAKLCISTMCDISGKENYNRLLAGGMTPDEIEQAANEVARGEY